MLYFGGGKNSDLPIFVNATYLGKLLENFSNLDQEQVFHFNFSFFRILSPWLFIPFDYLNFWKTLNVCVTTQRGLKIPGIAQVFPFWALTHLRGTFLEHSRGRFGGQGFFPPPPLFLWTLLGAQTTSGDPQKNI